MPTPAMPRNPQSRVPGPGPATPSPSRSPAPPAPTAEAGGERLQKLIAAAGLCSRRTAEAWIEAGRVTVDGRRAQLGARALPGSVVAVDGVPVAASRSAPRVIAYHKPVGEVVTRSDPGGRPTVFDRLPPLAHGKWIAVGRLDLNTSGLLLFTDSGDLANRLMHPRFGLEREYALRVQGGLDPAQVAALRRGVDVDGQPARFERIEATSAGPAEGSNRWYTAVLREGRNREVRRLVEAVGRRVSRLVRTRYGAERLGRELAPGAWRELDRHAVEALAEIAVEGKIR